MRTAFIFCLLTCLTLAEFSCRQKAELQIPEQLQQHCVQQLTRVLVHDIVSPPLAGRIYAYTNLAWYEAMRHSDRSAGSFTEKMKGFGSMPLPESGKTYDYSIAAVQAFFSVGRELVFSKDSIEKVSNSLLNQLTSSTDAAIFGNSIAFGKQVAAIILKRAAEDNYRKTRGLPRYSAFGEPGLWQQTPPDYADASEPYWGTLMPLLSDSAGMFAPAPPPAYDTNRGSRYRTELDEVFSVSKNITPEQDSIAYYWDDNPFVTKHQGHFTFATKKTTPGGHWMGITALLCRNEHADALKTAAAFALVSAAIHDGFISCWHEKFRSRTVRPITVIRERFEPEWNSLLQTPAFPEYTSGHSVISGAASTVLENLFPKNQPFTDTTELEYLGIKRNFSSVTQAAEEACISRLYGGIHYRSAIEEGKKQGRAIGQFYNNTFR